MTGKSADTTGADSTSRISNRGGGREYVGTRAGQYMVAAVAPGGATGRTKPDVLERLRGLEGIEVVRTITAVALLTPAVTVVRMTHDKAMALARSAGALIVEADEVMFPASLAMVPAVTPPAALAVTTGPGFATTIQVLGENDEPVERAEVQLVGQYWTAQGLTGTDGKLTLTLYGELPDRVAELRVEPRQGYWGLRHGEPRLRADAVNIVVVRKLPSADDLAGDDLAGGDMAGDGRAWAERAMRFDQIPQRYRGSGCKVAIIDHGVATSHKQLRHIERGFAVNAREARTWSQDASGHGTQCAGIIAARREDNTGLRGLAPEAELHSCKLPDDACCSDLIAALDYCVSAGIDVALLGLGCRRGSLILDNCIAAAKQHGVALIAAAGNSAGPVQFPASSRHVLAVGALGRTGAETGDQPVDPSMISIDDGRGLFVPSFSCKGPELDLCAPGVAVISCQAPEGYVSRDGTSLAAAHVAALAALVLAHNGDLRRSFATRDANRVERLFQILKDTAQPMADATFSGAGLPDAARALGLRIEAPAHSTSLNDGLEAMRNAMRGAGLTGHRRTPLPEPSRGPALVTALPLWQRSMPHFAHGAPLAGAGLDDLEAAMRMAGLSTGK